MQIEQSTLPWDWVDSLIKQGRSKWLHKRGMTWDAFLDFVGTTITCDQYSEHFAKVYENYYSPHDQRWHVEHKILRGMKLTAREISYFMERAPLKYHLQEGRHLIGILNDIRHERIIRLRDHINVLLHFKRYNTIGNILAKRKRRKQKASLSNESSPIKAVRTEHLQAVDNHAEQLEALDNAGIHAAVDNAELLQADQDSDNSSISTHSSMMTDVSPLVANAFHTHDDWVTNLWNNGIKAFLHDQCMSWDEFSLHLNFMHYDLVGTVYHIYDSSPKREFTPKSWQAELKILHFEQITLVEQTALGLWPQGLVLVPIEELISFLIDAREDRYARLTHYFEHLKIACAVDWVEQQCNDDNNSSDNIN